MSFGENVPNPAAGVRRFYRVTPATGMDNSSSVDKHLTSLADLTKTVERIGLGSEYVGMFFEEPEEPVKFEFVAVSKGEGESVELYYSADGRFETLGKRLKSVYPSSFDIEEVHRDLGHMLVKPVTLSRGEFKDRLNADQLYRDREEYIEYPDEENDEAEKGVGEPGRDGVEEPGEDDVKEPSVDGDNEVQEESRSNGEGDDPDSITEALTKIITGGGGVMAEDPVVDSAKRDAESSGSGNAAEPSDARDGEKEDSGDTAVEEGSGDSDAIALGAPDKTTTNGEGSGANHTASDSSQVESEPDNKDRPEPVNADETPADSSISTGESESEGGDLLDEMANSDAPEPVEPYDEHGNKRSREERRRIAEERRNNSRDPDADDDSRSGRGEGDDEEPLTDGGVTESNSQQPEIDENTSKDDIEDVSESASYSPDIPIGEQAIEVADEPALELGDQGYISPSQYDESIHSGIRFRLDEGYVELNPPSAIPENGPLVDLDGPTLTEDGNILVRPSIEYTTPNATRWYGREETIGDWMTTLDTATESNPEYESGSDDEDVDSPEALQTLFVHLQEATEPTAFQVVFEPKDDWSSKAQRRKKEIRSGEFDKHWIEDIIFQDDIHLDRDLKAFEYRRIKLIENKRPTRTFNANVRAVSLTSSRDFSNDEDDPANPPGDEQERIERTLQELTTLLDPLDGVYYSIEGELMGNETSLSGADHTAGGVVKRFLERDLITSDDERGAFTSLNVFNDPKKHPEIVVNGRELGELIVIPSGDDMDADVFRSTGTRHQDLAPLTRPRPNIHKEFREGMALGFAYDENGKPEDQVTRLPKERLPYHWALFGSSGSGKTINGISMLLSAHADTGGPTILVDPKAGNMIENYAKAHKEHFGDLRDVYTFSVPETLPVIPFFDIRPLLYEGMNRDDAIQQKADEFHMIMNMIDENYSTAYVAKTVLGSLIKAKFDAVHGSDAYTLDELYSLAVDMYADQKIPRVSHQPQVEKILSNQLNNNEQDFKQTMGAVLNRLNDLQEDINLYRLFNQLPEWDEQEGRYEIEREDDHRSALDFREHLDKNEVLLFDTGDLVRDESQRAFSMYILSSLWTAIKSTYQDKESHEDIDNTVKLVIEEAAPIVTTELVTNTLIPEAREFGLSLGMVMQYPEQVKSHGVDGSYKELINNVGTKIYGKVEQDSQVADSLVHDDKNQQELKNKVSSLGPGEWIVDLPSPAFGIDVPRPFSVHSLPVPKGHPEGDAPLSKTERRQFYKQFNSRKSRTRKLYGVERTDPSKDDPDNGDESEDSVTFDTGSPSSGTGTEDGTDTGQAEASEAKTTEADLLSDSVEPTRKGDSPQTTEQDEQEEDTVTAVEWATSSADEEPETTEPTPAGPPPSEGANTGDGGWGDIEPLPESDIAGHLERADLSRLDGVENARQTLESVYDDDNYHRALKTLAAKAQEAGTDISPGDLADTDVGGVEPDAEEMAGDKSGTEREARPDDFSEPGVDDHPAPPESEPDELPSAVEEALAERSQEDSDEESDGDPESDDSSDDAVTDTDVPEDESPDNDVDEDRDEQEDEDETNGSELSDVNFGETVGSQDDDVADAVAAREEALDTTVDTSTEESDEEFVKDTGEFLDLPTPGGDDGSEDSDEPDTTSEAESEVQPDTPAEGEEPEDESEDVHAVSGDLEFDITTTPSRMSEAERERLRLSKDDVTFMSLIAAAFRDELDDYTLMDSMTELKNRAGNPDIDLLREEGYVEQDKVSRRRYYSLTRKGWGVLNEQAPGDGFGDYFEKIKHRVGTHILAEALSNKPDVYSVEIYERVNGETIDVIAYGEEGTVTYAGEVETGTNDDAGTVEDYDKLSDLSGEKIWIVPTNSDLETVWNHLENAGRVEEVQSSTTHRASNLQEFLDDNPQEGFTMVRTYSQLESTL